MGAAGRGLRIRRVLGRNGRGVRCARRRSVCGGQATMAERAGPPPLAQCRMEGPRELARNRTMSNKTMILRALRTLPFALAVALAVPAFADNVKINDLIVA